MRFNLTRKRLMWAVLFLAALVCLLVLNGCTSEREQAAADSAATIWEGADAIERGVPAAKVTPSIKANAAAIIKSNGATYAPAGVTP